MDIRIVFIYLYIAVLYCVPASAPTYPARRLGAERARVWQARRSAGQRVSRGAARFLPGAALDVLAGVNVRSSASDGPRTQLPPRTPFTHSSLTGTLPFRGRTLLLPPSTVSIHLPPHRNASASAFSQNRVAQPLAVAPLPHHRPSHNVITATLVSPAATAPSYTFPGTHFFHGTRLQIRHALPCEQDLHNLAIKYEH